MSDPADSPNDDGAAGTWTQAEETLASYQGRLALLDHEAQQLRRSCHTPRQLLLMVRLLAQPSRLAPDGRGNFRHLLHEVRDSSFTLGEWIAALEVFYRWLEKEERRAPLGEVISYLHCCAEATEAQAGWSSLSACTQAMLDDFGYRGQEY